MSKKTKKRDKNTFFSVEEIIALHNKIILESGGTLGILNISNIIFLVDLINNPPIQMDIIDKASYIIHHIISGHPFADGNKRTGLEVCKYYLSKNQHIINVGIDESINFVLSIGKGEKEIDQVKEWIRQHIRKI